MTVKARIIGRGGQLIVDCVFAEGLAVGSHFVLRHEDGVKSYRVTGIIHYPTSIDGNADPMIGYGVSEISRAKWWKNKQFWLDVVTDLAVLK
jgi:hypothetical protein